MSDFIQNDSAIATDDEMANMYLTFSVGEEVYGMEIRYVLQIINMQEITAMPEMPPSMKGFINLRGTVFPVVSMRARFGKMETEYTDRNCIVVVQVNDRQIGLIVDTIRETLTIEPESISPPPTTGIDGATPYIMGIGRIGSASTNTAVLIHINKLFDGYSF